MKLFWGIGFGPHPHPPWGWGIDFEKPRGWGILTQTPWGFGGVFDAFLCFSDRKNFLFLLVFEKKARFFFLLENLHVYFAKKSFKQPPFHFIKYPYSQQCCRFSTKNPQNKIKINFSAKCFNFVALISSLIQKWCPYYCLADISQPFQW